jgi:septal ring factor EnvC (AmiA/AmiB activator)
MAMLLAPACRQPDDGAAIRDRLRTKDAAEVVREAAAVRYTPPADGRLTDGQVRMYLKVRERECRIREAAAFEAQRRRAAADLRAAQEVKVNPKEYAWVREQVLEAEAATTTQTLYQKMAAGREQLLARMRRDRDALTDPSQRGAAQREIEDWKRGLQAAEPPIAPAVRANVALLARYREPFARLRALEERALAAAAGVEAPAGSGAAAAVR